MTTRIPVTVDPDYSWIDDAPSYDQIVETFGDILTSATQHDYQGDTLYALRSGDRFGYLDVGWGSCSGCDALQACESQQDIDNLQDRLEAGVKWFESFAEFKSAVLSSEHYEHTYLDEELVAEFRANVAALTEPTPSGSGS